MTVTVQVPVLTYRTLDDLAGQSTEAVLAVWLLRRELKLEEWLALLVDVLLAVILQAEQWGRLFGQVARPVNGLPLLPIDDRPRPTTPEDFEQRSALAPAPHPVIDYAARERELTRRLDKALRTLADQPAGRERVERLAHDEPIAAAQRGYQDGIRLQQDVTVVGYRRGINPDCCELCFWLWKEGYVYPIDQPMHRHIGCRCVPVPTTDRIGRQRLTVEEQALLNDLYDRYQTPRNRRATP